MKPPALYLAWPKPPSAAELVDAVRRHPKRPLHLIVCLPEPVLPDWTAAGNDPLYRALADCLRCVQFTGSNYCSHILPDVHLWLLPEAASRRLYQHFPQPPQWQDTPVPQETPVSPKPWFAAAPSATPQRVLLIGAGIAGAATAYELAQHGVEVCVLEAGRAAGAASGNRQGLLYAKISPHPTEQTELLLCGYGYTRRLLERLLPENDAWGGHGVLHLNHNEAESRRNAALSQHAHHRHLYRSVSATEAAAIAGIPFGQDALYWPQGVWLNPATLIRALLAHPLIRLHENTPLQNLHRQHGLWHADTPQGRFSGSHIVFCCGADSVHTPLIRDFPFRQIRGQTSVVRASSGSRALRAALSGSSYISPSWQDGHCFGASFIPDDGNTELRQSDEAANRRALAELSPYLHQSFTESFTDAAHGHAAVRCDSRDHLPVVGALGEAAQMRRLYAKLAADKNYRLNTPCPWWENAYANTAHGSRGLATAPLCAAEIAAQICGTPAPLSARLRQALHPNRLIIRDIIHGH